MILTLLMTVIMAIPMDGQSFIEYMADMEECYCDQ